MTEVPYFKRRTQHRIGKSGRKSEQRVAKMLGGRLRPASGALEGAKGDIVMDKFLVEAKSSQRMSITIKLDWLCKIAREARSEGKTPALTVSFVTPEGRAQLDGDWVMIPMHTFEEMLS